MNTPVSFEIAKLLRGKGFSEKTLQAYVYRGIEHQDSSYKGWLTKDKLLCDISAPTIADVVMWLYEKHEIWIEVRNVYFTDFAPIIKGQSRLELNRCISPTEAYSQAIEYTLKNLI